MPNLGDHGCTSTMTPVDLRLPPPSTGARKRVEDVDPSGQRCLIENCGKDTLKLTYVFPRENVPDRFLVSRAHKVVFSLVVLA